MMCSRSTALVAEEIDFAANVRGIKFWLPRCKRFAVGLGIFIAFVAHIP